MYLLFDELHNIVGVVEILMLMRYVPKPTKRCFEFELHFALKLA